MLQEFCLRCFKLRDSKYGGATDTTFLFGLGGGPGFGVLPCEGNTIERSLRHFLDGGTETIPDISVVDMNELPLLDLPPRKVI